jgi:hypothetical protein
MTPAEGTIAFKNGIGTANFTLGQFDTNADTVYIVLDDNDTEQTADDRFYTAKGIPTDGSKINVDGALLVSIPAGTTTANFVYANTGDFENFSIKASTPAFQYDTVIYVDATAAATAVTNDLGSTGILLGYTWQYGNVLDMVNGKLITVHTAYNFRLEAGKFYVVSNGYVEGLATTEIAIGTLVDYTKFTSTIKETSGMMNNEPSAPTMLFRLIGGNVELVNGALINRALEAPVVRFNSTVYYYTGAQEHNRVMLVISEPDPVTVISEGTPLTIAGNPRIGKTLSINGLEDILPAGRTISIQWYKAGYPGVKYTPIYGATSATYTVQADDLGCFLMVIVKGTGAYTGVIASDPTNIILPGEALQSIEITYTAGEITFTGTLTAAIAPSYAADDVTYKWYKDVAGV